MRYGMVIDLTMCMGCHTCAVACKQANNLPNGVWWNKVYTDGGEALDTARGHTPTTSQDLLSCQLPALQQSRVRRCMSHGCFVCSRRWLRCHQRRRVHRMRFVRDGVPYGVRTLFSEPIEYSVGFPVGDPDAPVHISATMGKCTGCANRIERGAVPACMDLCLVVLVSGGFR